MVIASRKPIRLSGEGGCGGSEESERRIMVCARRRALHCLAVETCVCVWHYVLKCCRIFSKEGRRVLRREGKTHCHRIANAISYQVFQKYGPRERDKERDHTKGFFCCKFVYLGKSPPWRWKERGRGVRGPL